MSVLAGLNWMLVPTLILALLLFFAGRRVMRRSGSAGAKFAMLLVGVVLSVPGFIYASYYVLRFQDWMFFLKLRSLPGSELLAAGVGLLLGAIAGTTYKRHSIRTVLLTGALVVIVLVPYHKQLLFPLTTEQWSDSWSGELCRQTTESTCGPACAATILKHFGIVATEEELARQCHTTATGTENWYLLRALRSRGLHVEYMVLPSPPTTLPVTSIAGMKAGSFGHYVTILGQTDAAYIVGDPMIGRREIPKKTIFLRYDFTGFFLVVSRD